MPHTAAVQPPTMTAMAIRFMVIARPCTQTAQRFRLAARDGGVTVTVRAVHVWLEADPRLIDPVVSNFVTSAIRYTPAGGKVEIRAARRRRPPAVVIAVRDTGSGIAPEHLDRIFDRLYRTDEARDRATGGYPAAHRREV